MEVESKPEEIETLDRRIIQLKIEREALGKEGDRYRVEGPARRTSGELANLEQQSAELTHEVAGEKDKIAREAKIKEQLDAAAAQLEQAQRAGDLGKRASSATAPFPG
jgi:ATP-dependent Clp protease ATP-binding subunit ClpB